jgi:hypothetical protein
MSALLGSYLIVYSFSASLSRSHFFTFIITPPFLGPGGLLSNSTLAAMFILAHY